MNPIVSRNFSSGEKNQDDQLINFTIRYDIDFDKVWNLQGKIGDKIMYVGLDAGIPFEQACGGNAECCTCHIIAPVEEIIETERDFPNATDQEIYEEAGFSEQDALDFAEGVKPNSRLACQLRLSRGCEGKEFIFMGESIE